MAAAHGDPLRQSQRRSGHGNSREVYPIDYEAYQMGSSMCGSGCRCPSAEEPALGPAEETSSGVAIVSSEKETAKLPRVSKVSSPFAAESRFAIRDSFLNVRKWKSSIRPEY